MSLYRSISDPPLLLIHEFDRTVFVAKNLVRRCAVQVFALFSDGLKVEPAKFQMIRPPIACTPK